MTRDGRIEGGAACAYHPREMTSQADDEPAERSALRRGLYVGLGSACVALAAVGVVLPLVPTTPFLLLAGFFFARSSPRLDAWLQQSPVFGPYLRQWKRERTVPRRAKLVAILMVTVTLGSSILFAVEATWLRGLLATLLVGLVAFLSRLPSAPAQPSEPESSHTS